MMSSIRAMHWCCFFLWVVLFNCMTNVSAGTGFWYGNSRPPVSNYDSIPFANMTVKIDLSIEGGPGQTLVTDPYNNNNPLYVGNTINRQTFDTQFILDMSYALGIDTHRIFVTDVSKGNVHFTWESFTVIVQFIFLERNQTSINGPTLLEAIALLTESIQNPLSKVYHGTNITRSIDPLWGVLVNGWDVSLKLTYAIQVIGGDAIQDGYYLNQGGLGVCDLANSAFAAKYCEFERFFEDDVSRALAVSNYRIQILFIKTASLDSVLVHFRISPPKIGSSEDNVGAVVVNLVSLVVDQSSPLYYGNVTIRVDPTWGVSGSQTSRRPAAAKFTNSHYEEDPVRLKNKLIMSTFVTPYDRCKANRRCNWGIVHLNQTTNDVKYYQRIYERGMLYGVNLFLDFEDWRLGSRGFSWKGSIPPTYEGFTSIPRARAINGVIRGAHFNPFTQRSLGPDIPALFDERNQGLVLCRSLQVKQIAAQSALVEDITGRIDFLTRTIEYGVMNAEHRSRRDVRINTTLVREGFIHWQMNEIQELKELNTSQCSKTHCRILFNTSSLTLTGAINDVGVIRKTPGGTEVAVFAFNSIYLGPETEVVLVGQRAFALVSKTTAIINTTIHSFPGNNGGFRGGESVARLESDRLNDNPQSLFICNLGNYCLDNKTYTNLVSNNVNGPGSGNLRVTPFVVTTSASVQSEVQVIKTSAREGQTIDGGFILHFKDYSTAMIPFNASAADMKATIEANLNLAPPDTPILFERSGARIAGVGIVHVTRESRGIGYTWNVTFTTYIGNAEQITVTSYLKGLEADVTTATLVQGNELQGSFTLSYMGYVSAPISVRESAEGLADILMSMPPISTAYVVRNDPSNNCDDGLCPNGPYVSRGMMWMVYITTDAQYGDVTPISPTSPVANNESEYFRITPNIDNVIGIGGAVHIAYGSSTSTDQMMSVLNITRPFSLAFGGAGASYGGRGGAGYSLNPVGPNYNDAKLTDLLGGSGGCMRSIHPYEINIVLGAPSGRGGHGGGAIEIVAANDIVLGTFGAISARGEDGQQSSGGGGGGGSGGAILLAAGGSILNDGLVDVSGGNGGFGGFGFEQLSGGGGGGGRVAMYAESITLTGKVRTDGGKCGAYRIPVTMPVAVLNVEMTLFQNAIPLDDDRISVMAATFVNITVSNTIDVFPTSVHRHGPFAVVNVTVTASLEATILDQPSSTASSNPQQATRTDLELMAGKIQLALNRKVGLDLAAIILQRAHLSITDITTVKPTLALPTACHNNGEAGTLYTESTMTTSMYVGVETAAEGTGRALFFSNREITNTSSGSSREAPFSWNGPIMPFEPSQPTRVTYYTRMEGVDGQSNKANYGALFSLLSRGVQGLNVSSVIGVFLGDRISHGANFGSAVDEKTYLKRSVTLWNYPVLSTWYKVDIHINWDRKTYTILLNDAIQVQNAPFTGEDVDGIRISVTRAVDVWFDEIYVGFDNMMDFTCPFTDRTGTSTAAPVQRHWSPEEVHGTGSAYTEYYKMTRHYNHLDSTQAIAFDGQGAIKDNQDIKYSYPEGDIPLVQGKLHAGALRYLTNSVRSGKTPSDAAYTAVSEQGLWYAPGNAGDGRQFWYTEYNAPNPIIPSLNGGIAACSSQDMLTWRFEGFVFQYANLSDLVLGTEGPFFVERPKVQKNPLNNNFVMWAAMDNGNRTLAMTMVATSPNEDGPFYFRRSFYPDGNYTRDQVFFNDANRTLVARTYFQTVEYLMPAAMMQPIWESVKFRNGSVNFRSSYHRAMFEPGYDNYHDIFNQRWRNESNPWNVVCVNKITGAERHVDAGKYNEQGTVCNDPEEYKIVSGQGNPVVQSLFIDPNNSDNSWWVQTSVPAVVAQPWASSYRDGYCGIRLLNDNHDILDPTLVDFTPEDRSTCSNIADNPVHVSLQDKLIGVQRVITTRRAKFLALSELTPDYLDTSGVLNSFEGELATPGGVAIDLLSLIAEMGQFGFDPGNSINSTFRAPVRSDFDTADDYSYRFRQFIRNPNDRASYSLACVLDEVCPVNFAKQLF